VHAYNGPQSLYYVDKAILRQIVGGKDVSGLFSMRELAEHQADVEGIDVRVTPQLDRVIDVAFWFHGSPYFYPPSVLTFSGQRVHGWSALNSHASYPFGLTDANAKKRFLYPAGDTGTTFRVDQKIPLFKVDAYVGDVIAPAQSEITPSTLAPKQAKTAGIRQSSVWENFPLVQVGTLKDGTRVGPAMAEFSGRLGEVRYLRFASIDSIGAVDGHHSPADEANQEKLRKQVEPMVKAFCAVERNFLEPKMRGLVESAGPVGFGARTECVQRAAWTGTSCRNPPDGKPDVCHA